MMLKDLTNEEAEEFVRHVERREDPCLIDLAHLMAEHGGPIDQFDGSARGLELFAKWFRSWRLDGSPSLDLRVPISLAVATGEDVEELKPGGALAAQLLEHARKVVIQAHIPDARWGAHLDAEYPDMFRNEVWTVWAGGAGMRGTYAALSEVRGIDERAGIATDYERVGRIMRGNGVPIDERPWRSGPLLVNYLELPRPPHDDPRRQPPIFAEHESYVAPIVTRDPSLQLMVLAEAGADLDRPSKTRALDEGAVFDALKGSGLTLDGTRPATAARLRRSGQAYLLGDQVLVQVIAQGGRLRALVLRPGNPKLGQWKSVVSALGMYAERAGVRFGPENERVHGEARKS